MSDDKREQRVESRHDFLSTIEFILDPANSGKLYKGVIINLNSGGLGIYVLEQFNAGQRIVIKAGLPVAQQKAAICWIKKENAVFYRAGLKLL
jgi:hypothetical protein